MRTVKRVTVNLPAETLAAAQRLTGKGLTETIVAGLHALDRRARLAEFRRFRGKIAFDLDLDRTRR